MTTFPSNLKRLRKAKNITQDTVAQALHVTRQTVSGWETGRTQPDLDTLTALARVLEADIHELIYGVKPGGYPRYQKRYVLTFGISAGVSGLMLLFWIFVMPLVKRYCAMTYSSWGMNLHFILPQIGWFAAGLALPAALAMVYRTSFSEKTRKALLPGGIVMILPAVLMPAEVVLFRLFPGWVGWMFRALYPWIVSDSGLLVIQIILPLLSGAAIFLGTDYEL